MAHTPELLAALALLTLSACASGGGAGRIAVNPGPEDFEYDAAHHRLIVGCRPPVFVPIAEDGSAGAVTPAIPGGMPKLHMVGISLTPDGKRLYAINRETRLVEVFDVTPDALVHRGSLPRDDRVGKYANEVFAVRADQVYVSNAQGSRHPILEALFKRPQANVMLWDGERWREVANGIRFGNGMQISADETTLYVAGFQDCAIHVYARAADGSLHETGQIEVGASPDNLKWADAARTRLLVASHPSQFRTFLHLLTGGRAAAPSQVRTVAVPPARPDVQVIYPAGAQTGREIHAASTAMLQGDRLTISQIVRPYLYQCTIERPAP